MTERETLMDIQFRILCKPSFCVSSGEREYYKANMHKLFWTDEQWAMNMEIPE